MYRVCLVSLLLLSAASAQYPEGPSGPQLPNFLASESATPASTATGPRFAIEDSNWDTTLPRIVARGDGAMAIWSGQSDGNYDLFASTITASGQASRPTRLTTAPFADFNARAVSDGAGNVTLA